MQCSLLQNISANAVADESIGPVCDILAYRDLIAAAVASSSTLDDNMTTLLTLLNRTAKDACLVVRNGYWILNHIDLLLLLAVCFPMFS